MGVAGEHQYCYYDVFLVADSVATASVVLSVCTVVQENFSW